MDRCIAEVSVTASKNENAPRYACGSDGAV